MLKQRKRTTATIYMIVLLITCLAMFKGYFSTPDSLTNAGVTTHQSAITPSERSTPATGTTVYRFTGITWTAQTQTLLFYTRHQLVTVEADGALIYERAISEESVLSTTGRSCEFVTIPDGTKSVVVTLINCNSSETFEDPLFYQGNGVEIFRAEIISGLGTLLLSCLVMILGLLMLAYWLLVHRWAYVSRSLMYLGIFTAILGLWFCLDTEVCMLVFTNAVYRSYVSRLLLPLMCIPFVMFVRHYLRADDRYLFRIYVWADTIEIALLLFLQVTQLADLSHTLRLTHVMLAIGILYFIYTIFTKFRRHEITRPLWICTFGAIMLIVGYWFDLNAYYTGTRDFSVTGRLFVFLFIVLLAIDSTMVSLREIDAGRKASHYRELAEKDILTGCYSRNAYHNDSRAQRNLSNVLLAAFDLNNLKYYNDRFGHECGDRYIISSVQIIQRVFSKYGKLYRMGGDEFLLFMPDHRNCDMDQLIEEFKHDQDIYNTAEKEFHMQIACGYAYFDPQLDQNLDDLQKRADELMYLNKRRQKEKAKAQE